MTNMTYLIEKYVYDSVVLVMNACIFMPNIHLIHKRAKNIHDLNAYNKYSLGKLYRQSWHSVIINCRRRRRQRLPAPLPDPQL
jgi:hypothetical protein